MPSQAVTLEPMVQGERAVAILRLLGGPSMHTDRGSSHSVGFWCSAQFSIEQIEF